MFCDFDPIGGTTFVHSAQVAEHVMYFLRNTQNMPCELHLLDTTLLPNATKLVVLVLLFLPTRKNRQEQHDCISVIGFGTTTR